MVTYDALKKSNSKIAGHNIDTKQQLQKDGVNKTVF
jgi:hypothetical protein